jgi:UDP-glucose 4-epimerase
MDTETSNPKSVLVTGAGGYLGRLLVEELATRKKTFSPVTAVDVNQMPSSACLEGVDYHACDVRSSDLVALFVKIRPTAVVHLAGVVTPGRKSTRAFA